MSPQKEGASFRYQSVPSPIGCFRRHTANYPSGVSSEREEERSVTTIATTTIPLNTIVAEDKKSATTTNDRGSALPKRKGEGVEKKVLSVMPQALRHATQKFIVNGLVALAGGGDESPIIFRTIRAIMVYTVPVILNYSLLDFAMRKCQ
jgi:hypothetical protein